MTAQAEFENWRDLDPESAEEAVFRRYAQRLARVAEEQIASRHRAKFDGEDVVQSALRSFFERDREGQFELTSWNGLWGLLVRITLRKCGRTAAYWDAAKRDAKREISLESAEDASQNQRWQAIEPTAEQAATLRDTIDAVCAGLNEKQREMFLLDLAGFNGEEVSERVGRSMRTVRRTLKEIRTALANLAEAEARDDKKPTAEEP